MMLQYVRPLVAVSLVSACLAVPANSVEETVAGELGAKLDEYLARLEANGVSGAFLVAKDGEIALAKGYGFADREREIPVTTDTVFTIGSITKQFTGAAILKLEEEGKLNVEDRLRKHIKEVPRDKRDVTIHHLLTHTAGMPSAYGDDFAVMTADDMIAKFVSRKLRPAAGEKHRYSNPGYSLLGILVERVSGKGYEAYLHDSLFKPLGMNDTGYTIPKWNPDRMAQGYLDNGEKWGTLLDKKWAEDGPYWNLRANGGIMSTLGDLYKWHVALQGDEALSPESKAKYFARHVAEDDSGNWHYGYGWAIANTERDTTLISHNGGNGIFFADFRRYVDDDVLIIMMTNVAQLYTDEHHRNVRRIVFGFPVELPALKEQL